MIRKALLVITSLLFLLNVAVCAMGYSRKRIDINLTESNMVD